MPKNDNTFFVIDYDIDKQILHCVEVDSYKPKVYNMAILDRDQVLPVKWKGPKDKTLNEYLKDIPGAH